jgi:anti-sigma B factor antagonist
VQPDRARVIVKPVGELDLLTVPQVDRQLRELVETGFERVVVDLRGLTFIDSTGIKLFVEWHARSRGDGFAMELIAGPPNVQRPFEITGLLDRLPFAPAR